MASVKNVAKYNSIHFAVPEGATPNDYYDDENITMRLALDMATIRSETEGPRNFHDIVKLYFMNREKMIPVRENKNNDATLEAHKMTLLTLCGEALVEACQLLNVEYTDTRLNIETRYMPNSKKVGGSVELGINKDVPEHKRVALNIIFDEFQTTLKNHGVKTAGKKPKNISDADYDDISDIEIDDVNAKA
jgi:hypothetical protein